MFYANEAIQYVNKHKSSLKLIDFPSRFSNLVLVDKHLNVPSNQKKIQNFCANRTPVIFDVNDHKDYDKIYVNKSNASRCFYNFFTNSRNYELMNHICSNLIPNQEIRETFEQLYIPQSYTSI